MRGFSPIAIPMTGFCAAGDEGGCGKSGKNNFIVVEEVVDGREIGGWIATEMVGSAVAQLYSSYPEESIHGANAGRSHRALGQMERGGGVCI
jgi:hypothetical protein